MSNIVRSFRAAALAAISCVHPVFAVTPGEPAVEGPPAATADAWLGPPATGAAYPAGEADRQFAVLQYDLSRREHFAKVAAESFRPEALIQTSDRDPLDVLLRRTQSLLDDVVTLPEAPTLHAERAALEQLRSREQQLPVTSVAERRMLFNEALLVRRRIAFANPVLAGSGLLFVKRQLASMYPHMCDQFYGLAQEPGGGIFVLEQPFAENPRLRNLLDKAIVENGRLKGEQLTGGPRRRWAFQYDGNGTLKSEETMGGSFATPALSFDGKRLAFAYVECRGRPTHEFHLEPQARGYWDQGRAYHLFSVGLDGSGLAMLTDGGWNDFSPCWTPAGRVAFISERRGGYLRCGRVCPNYTLYDMAADGSGIRRLSHHDTNEWAPVISHDGRIVWTRWDYVDRHAEVAHHPWTTTPDGRDARSMHGNYSIRATRADMETDLQPIPGSRRFIGTAAPHHGQSFGSLVVIDPSTPDDDRMAPVRRFTPEVGFPESQQGSLSYGTPWPLHERYHLCAYEPVEVNGVGRAFQFGIYLVDAFGNKELVYHDPDIACVNPVMLRARPAPQVIAEQRIAENDPAPDADATVTVMDVYQGLKPWPEGTRIRSLRIWQLLPFNVPSLNAPHNIGIQQPGTNSISLARSVVGEVPVEADGSAFFKVPSGRQLFFQALDEKGLAVQSMRAGTYFQPGERASCIGCHEPRDGAPPAPTTGTLQALLREPSIPKPSFDGTNPFSYPRLVQPVLDAKCAGCHTEKKASPLTRDLVRLPGGGMNLTTTYYVSYLSLAPFTCNDYGDPYRTTPGNFGARASKLHRILDEGHYDLRLTDEERARISLWLDSRAQFYGTYHREGGEAQLRGEVVLPVLE